uniref:Uncharacterized protein n=1 Tax=Globodera rostochiensis TaxID=31243 RepID=A0A914GWI4_GLORO
MDPSAKQQLSFLRTRKSSSIIQIRKMATKCENDGESIGKGSAVTNSQRLQEKLQKAPKKARNSMKDVGRMTFHRRDISSTKQKSDFKAKNDISSTRYFID